MSLGRIGSAVSVLMIIAALTLAASAAHAQTGGSGWVPTRTTEAPVETMSSASVVRSFDLGSLRLGMPLQQGASLLAYRWFSPMFGSRLTQSVRFAPRDAVVSAWWRKRI